MGNIIKTITHLYVDDRNQVQIVIEYVNGSERELRTDEGELCESIKPHGLEKIKATRSGKTLILLHKSQLPSQKAGRYY